MAALRLLNRAQIDLRISIMPTVEEESAVIRLLNAQAGLKSIGELGFNPRDAEAFADMMHKSFGLVLVTGRPARVNPPRSMLPFRK